MIPAPSCLSVNCVQRSILISGIPLCFQRLDILNTKFPPLFRNSRKLVRLATAGYYMYSFFKPPTIPPTHPLRPFKQNNTCPLCLAATAGTELVGANKELIIIFICFPIGLYNLFSRQIAHELSWVRVSPIAQYPRQNSPRLRAPGRFKSWCGSPFIPNLLRIDHEPSIYLAVRLIRSRPASRRFNLFYMVGFIAPDWSVISHSSPARRCVHHVTWPNQGPTGFHRSTYAVNTQLDAFILCQE